MITKYLIIGSGYKIKEGEVPFLKLLGKWLEEAGFKTGKSVKLEIESDKIAITPAPERDRLIEEKASQIHHLLNELRVLNSELLDLEEDGKHLKKHHGKRQKVLVG